MKETTHQEDMIILNLFKSLRIWPKVSIKEFYKIMMKGVYHCSKIDQAGKL